MNIKVDFDNIVVKEDKNDTIVKVLMLKGEKGDKGDGEQNVIEKVQVNGTDLPVANKTVNVSVPIVDNSISSSSTNPVQNSAIYNALSNKANTSDLNNYYQISEVDALLNKKPYQFNNVAEMKAYNLHEGDYIITKGYYNAEDGGDAKYIIVNDDTLTDDGSLVHELTNGLKAKLIINNNIINVLKIGCKRNDNAYDSTNKIQNLINSFNGITIYFPKGNYYLTNINIPIGSHNIKLIGDDTYKNATFIFPFTNMEGTMFTVGDPNTSMSNIVYGFTVKNLAIKGGNAKYEMNVFDLGRTSNVIFENVSISFIDGYALQLDGVYDSYFEKVEVTVCGNEEVSSIIMKGSTTPTNAIRFNNCRVEACVQYLNILDDTFQLMFTNTKFEDNVYSSSTTPIVIENDGDITFTACLFTAKASATEYMIKFRNNDYKTVTRFVGCMFECSGTNTDGGKYINTIASGDTSQIVISNSFFYYPNTAGAMLLDKATFVNNIIFPFTFSDDNNDYIIEAKNENIIKNNSFLGNSGNKKAYAIKLTGSNNIIKDNKYQSWDDNYKIKDIASYQRNELDFKRSYSISSAISNGVINALQSSIVSIPSNTTITNIINAWTGCTLYLYANGSGITFDTTNISFLFSNADMLKFTAGHTKVIKKVDTNTWIIVA